MIKNFISVNIILLLSVFSVHAQLNEYNRKGDEAFARKDYRDAKMWYEEGIANCDSYSIKQLTKIWLEVEEMRPSMRSVMAKSLNCINIKANDKDLESMDMLSFFYKEGIGTPRNEKLAGYWKKQYTRLSSLEEDYDEKKSFLYKKKDMEFNFLISYLYSYKILHGINLGAIWNGNGIYFRAKSNFQFRSSDFKVSNTEILSDFPRFSENKYVLYSNNKYKEVRHALSMGYIRNINNHFYFSLGTGYGVRLMLLDAGIYDKKNDNWLESMWAEYSPLTYKGLEIESDLMYRHKKLFISAGFNSVNFKFMDYTIGIGLFF